MVRQVVWPNDVKEIEAVLSDRQMVNQNWLPGESVDMLKVER
jgi:hypothetical protein